MRCRVASLLRRSQFHDACSEFRVTDRDSHFGLARPVCAQSQQLARFLIVCNRRYMREIPQLRSISRLFGARALPTLTHEMLAIFDIYVYHHEHSQTLSE